MAERARKGARSHAPYPVLADLVGTDEAGRPLVRIRGDDGQPVVARTALAPQASTRDERASASTAVLVVFEGGDSERPIIVGEVRDALGLAPDTVFALGKPGPCDLRVDGRSLVVDAQQEIELRCGKASIVLQRDGKVLIRGTHVVSRSSGSNKIKGGSISLN